MLILGTGWILLLLAVVPAVLYPLKVLLIDVPDVGWTLILAVAARSGSRLTVV